jgi:hypothetical protein
LGASHPYEDLSYKDDWDRLFAVMPLAKAHFGEEVEEVEEVEEALEAIWGQQAVVNVAAVMLGNGAEIAPAQRETAEHRIWEGFEPDPVGQRSSLR